jgi:hypothetical protein
MLFCALSNQEVRGFIVQESHVSQALPQCGSGASVLRAPQSTRTYDAVTIKHFLWRGLEHQRTTELELENNDQKYRTLAAYSPTGYIFWFRKEKQLSRE